MKERFAEGYHPFVLPFTIAMAILLAILIIGLIRIFLQLPAKDKRKLLKILRPDILYKIIQEVILESLLHVKIFKRNLVLGYMHASIAFGWFMLIFIGHIEVIIYTPQRNGVLYYPVFFRFFVMETNETLRGAFFFFLMDFFLVVVLVGIFLAIYKRFHSMFLGMRRTTKHSLWDLVAMYSLWMIFPLRLLAESFTANISGGSFLTKSINHLLNQFVSNPENVMPVWWAYSIALSMFLLVLPLTRYMHIPTEIILIIFRKVGIKSSSSADGFSKLEIYSCSSCGICIDACPMGVKKKNLKYSSIYFIRFLRRFNKQDLELAEKCLMCGKCVELCPVGIDSCKLKQFKREESELFLANQNFDYLKNLNPPTKNRNRKLKVLYYGGCMTNSTPSIIKSITKILVKSGYSWIHLDKERSICCGRPLLLTGKREDAKKLVEANSELIRNYDPEILLVSCPICLKMFNEEYKFKNIKILHHTQFIEQLLNTSLIKVKKSNLRLVYHDPCELGRGSKIYQSPRKIIKEIAFLNPVDEEKKESSCCGGSLGSLILSNSDREAVAQSTASMLTYSKPDMIITACPLCNKTLAGVTQYEVKDISTLVSDNLL